MESTGAESCSVGRWLADAGLGRFEAGFEAQGITEEKFVNLIVSDYARLGVTELNDRQTLFKLIQVVKREMDKSGYTPSSPSVAPSSSLGDENSPPNESRRPRAKLIDNFFTSSPSSTPSAEGATADTTPPRITLGGAPPAAATGEDSKTQASSSSATSGRRKKKGGRGASSSSCITVCVRKRPLNRTERDSGDTDCASTRGERVFVVREPRVKVDLTKYLLTHKFVFDGVFGDAVGNREIYERTCRPLVSFFLDGGNATCFAYGQTGSGKTYTMMGPEGGGGEQSGLYVLAVSDIFAQLRTMSNLKISASFFEIYGGRFYDLLNERRKLDLREDARGEVHTVGLRQIPCTGPDELIDMIQFGNGVRSQGVTGANTSSSRSHAILQISARLPGGKLHGKFSFIDLAGSERAADTTNNEKQTRIEGAEINKSLLALKECIRAMDQQAAHMPFRGSKLTQVLRDCLIGNSRTIMIATVSPGSSSVEHTLNTLRYADRVKEMKEPGSKKKNKHNAYMPHRAPRITPKSASRSPARGAAAGKRRPSPAGKPPASPSSVKRKVRSLPRPTSIGPIAAGASTDVHLRKPPPRLRRAGSDQGLGAAAAAARRRRRTPNGGKRSSSQTNIPVPRGGSPAGRSSPKRPPSDAKTRPRKRSSESPPAATPGAPTSAADAQARLEEMSAKTQKLQALVLDLHRKHIHSTMLKIKQEMDLLKRFESKRLSPLEYARSLEKVQEEKADGLGALSDKLHDFRKCLAHEELLRIDSDKWKRSQSR